MVLPFSRTGAALVHGGKGCTCDPLCKSSTQRAPKTITHLSSSPLLSPTAALPRSVSLVCVFAALSRAGLGPVPRPVPKPRRGARRGRRGLTRVGELGEGQGEARPSPVKHKNKSGRRSLVNPPPCVPRVPQPPMQQCIPPPPPLRHMKRGAQFGLHDDRTGSHRST